MKNKKEFSVNRADPRCRIVENIIVKFKIFLSVILLIISLILLIFNVDLPFFVYLIFFVVLFALPALLRKILYKKFGIKK